MPAFELSRLALIVTWAFSLLAPPHVARAQSAATLDTNNAAAVKSFLAEFDRTTPNSDKIEAGFADPEFRKKLEQWYLAGTNAVSTNAMLALGSAFSADDQVPQAIKLGEAYVKAVPGDWIGWDSLGQYLISEKSYGRALTALTNAAALTNHADPGETRARAVETQAGLAQVAVFLGRPDLLQRAATLLARTTPDQFRDEGARRGAALAIMAQAMVTRDAAMFEQSVRLADMSQIPVDDPLRQFVWLGCYVFHANGQAGAFRAALRRDTLAANQPPPAADVSFPLTADEIAALQARLKENDEGRVDLYAAQDDELCRLLIAYHSASNAVIPTKAKLALARCLGKAGQSAQALKLAGEYTGVFSNDWRGWRSIGFGAYSTGDYAKSVSALTNALALGGALDPIIPDALFAATIASDNLDCLQGAAAAFTRLKASTQKGQGSDSRILYYLLYLAVARQDATAFSQSVEGVSADQFVTGNGPLRTVFFIAWNSLHPAATAPLWGAYQSAAAAAK